MAVADALANIYGLCSGINGQILGQPYGLRRPVDPTTPVIAQPPLPPGVLPVSLDAQSANFAKAAPVGKPFYYGDWDYRVMQPGDYLIGAAGVFFIASQLAFSPPLVVQCSHILDVAGPQAEAPAPVPVAPGWLQGPYDGTTKSNRVPLLTGWPAAVLQGTKGEATPEGLPEDTRAPWWSVLLPPSVPIALRYGHILTDETGRTYTVSSAELTATGWRLTAAEAVS